MAITSAGAKRAVEKFAVPADIVACLFVNNHTPSVSDALDASDYVEPTWSGYGEVSLDDYGAADTDDGVAWVDHDEIVYTPNATGGSVYGVFFKDVSTGHLLGAALFETPIPVVNGVPIRVNPRVRARDVSL